MAETLFMIHGMWGGPWYWAGYRRLFEAAGHRTFAATLPFHDIAPGQPPDPRLGCASLLDYADALARQIGELEQKPVLIGHSMGGLLAQMLASRGLARAVVLLAPASPAGILALSPSVIRSFWRIATRWGFWQRPTRQGFDEAVYSMLHRLPPTLQRETYDRFVHESGRATFEIGLWPLDLRHASRLDASRIDCPMLIIAGREDRITPVRVVRQVAQRYRRVATYLELPNHAHWLVAEPGWEQIVAAIDHWLHAVGPAHRTISLISAGAAT
ncbi:MAG: alpha/beta hydrolase [Pseudomonadales bacterium]|nr:alpha/beta hydrolase [Pseudomonadales bacterium]